MKFGHHICAYEEEIVQALSKLVAIPSVCGEAEPGLPYGKSSAQALACILSMAEEMGFSTRNVRTTPGMRNIPAGRKDWPPYWLMWMWSLQGWAGIRTPLR